MNAHRMNARRTNAHRIAPFVFFFAFSLVVPLELSAQQTDKKFSIPDTDEGLPGTGPIRRYGWFQKLWHSRRSTWANNVEKDQKALVFLGDSITQGWGDNMSDSFPGVKVANRGISGDTTRGMLIRLQEDVLSLNPSGVVMLMGTNDLEEGAKPATIAANAKLIIDELKKHNDKMPIILCQVFPSSASKKRSAADIKEINKLYAKAVYSDPQVTVLDTWTLFANEAGDAKEAEFPDLLHPNESGYTKWAKALRPILATAGFVENTPDSFAIEEGFESLFNGTDLTGWVQLPTTERQKKQAARWQKNDPNAPPWPIIEKRTELDGKTSPDGRYAAINDRLVVTTPAQGRRIQQLWTVKEFSDDFVLKLEFRATPNADSGIFVRGKQLQCRDFLLAGPYKKLKRYRAQGWNEMVIKVKGEEAYCTCNGELLDAKFKVPASGRIGLEGDRGQVEYRRIRIGKDDGNLLGTTNRTAAWQLETHEDGKVSMAIDGDSLVLKTTAITDTDWHVQAYQLHLPLKNDTEYKVTFEAKSPESVTAVLLGMTHMPDNYTSIGMSNEFQLEPDYTGYEFFFTAENVAENNRLGFVLGREVGTVQVKNFKLVETGNR